MPHSPSILLATAVAALAVGAVPLAAQGSNATRTTSAVARSDEARASSSTPSDPALARAYALVIGGEGKRGRAVVDSLLAAAPAGSSRYAEVLYWRAAFAASTADAERDYRRLSVEYPLSTRAADALIALAQLEYVRSDTTLAVHHLQRLMIEHPAGVRSAKANFWAARVLFGARDPVRACSALRAARATAGADEVDLRNEIEVEVPKCGSGRAAERAATGITAARARAPAERAPAERAPAERTPARSSGVAKPAAAKPVAPGIAAAAPSFAVQVAAYSSKAEAGALAAKLGARGYAARVQGAGAPFRVQVGRYATRAEAVAALGRVRAAKLDGFVVETSAR